MPFTPMCKGFGRYTSRFMEMIFAKPHLAAKVRVLLFAITIYHLLLKTLLLISLVQFLLLILFRPLPLNISTYSCYSYY